MLRCAGCGQQYPAGTRFCPRDGRDLTSGAGESGGLSGMVLDGRYRLGRLIGQGGIGEVYLAEHLAMGKRVAVKVLAAQLATHDDYRRRFDREARAASRLHHLNCVAVTDYGRTETGISYLAMELLEGASLKEVILAGRPPLSRTLNIVVQLLRGLAHAHSEGIVHRDLKPANVILLQDQRSGRADHVKILDFGLAKIIDPVGVTEDVTLTRAGTILGTPAYISPEQAAGDEVDHRGDVYSVGVMTFELACGRRPFVSEEAVALIRAHVLEAAPDPRTLRPDIGQELSDAIQRALRKKPSERFQSAGEMQAALERTPEWLAAMESGLFAPSDASLEITDSMLRHGERAGALNTLSYAADLAAAAGVGSFPRVPRLADRQQVPMAALAGLLLALIATADGALGERLDLASVEALEAIAAGVDSAAELADPTASVTETGSGAAKPRKPKDAKATGGAPGTGAGGSGGPGSALDADGGAAAVLDPGAGNAGGMPLPGDTYKDGKVRRAAKAFEGGNAKEALKLLDDVIRRDEFHVEALALRARIRTSRNELAAALDDWNKALRFDSSGRLRADPAVAREIVWSMRGGVSGKKAYNVVIDRLGTPALPELVAAAAISEQRDVVYWSRRAIDALGFGKPGSGWEEAARALASAADCPGRKLALEGLPRGGSSPAAPVLRAIVHHGATRAGCSRELAAAAEAALR